MPVTGAPVPPTRPGRAPRQQGLTDLDAVLATLSLRNLVESIGSLLPERGDVLLVGAGLPVAAEVLAAAGTRVLAVDPSSAVLETIAPHPDVTTRLGDVHSVPADDHCLEAAIVLDAAASLDRSASEGALDELRRVLTPSGLAIISAPSSEPTADLLRHQLALRWDEVRSFRQVDIGGFALLPSDQPADTTSGPPDRVVAGRPLTGVVRWVHAGADRAVGAPTSTVHLAPGVPTGLTAGMHELLSEQSTSARRILELEARLADLELVQQRLVEAEQAAGRARELEAALVDSRARVEELHGMIDTILRSTSWRVTEPVRRASGVARSMSNKLALDTLRDTVRKYRES